ncbi:centrosomal protein of 85 kDa-like [Periophthalmus magnuspinnatus]|uniref:centrosomal protein of 85 kDa-like n=1 Tax=Periophthalmus magnuspinnatus TaxID=409849 RepID=UPI00145A492D|nr:centrosomal protein of 85 kDa-like [Periophthalmus magnuspinnatus]
MERIGADVNKTGCSSHGGSTELLSGPSTPGRAPRSRTSGRRASSLSDSGDTGFYTYSSDSVEDVSSILQPHSLLVSGLSPTSLRPLSLTRSYDQLSAQQQNTAQWYKTCQQLTSSSSPSTHAKKNNQEPIRKSSSLNKLSSWAVYDSTRTYSNTKNIDLQGSLDRGLLKGFKKDTSANKTDFYLPLTSSLRCNSSLLRSPGSGPCHYYKLSRKSTNVESDRTLHRSASAFSSPIKHNLFTGFTSPQDLCSRSLSEQPPFDYPLQPEVRTQMWLSEQLAYKPKFEVGKHDAAENYGDKLNRQPGIPSLKSGLKHMTKGSPGPVPGLVKFQEGLLRQREQEIDWQKQQIVQLQARITENELRVQQVQQSHRGRLDESYIYNKDRVGLPGKQASYTLCDKDLSQKLSAAEMELLHLKNVFKQVTQKYTEDICKMDDKIQTRDRYICSLKKKCARESEQKLERHQRVETLECYLADLPTLTEVQGQSQQLKEVQQREKEMEQSVSWLQKSLEEGQELLREKYLQIEQQSKRENELIASVHSLQQKVQRCLEDGVRVPVTDTKKLQNEKTELLEQQDCSSKQQQTEGETPGRARALSQRPEVSQLLRDMSMCVRDLQNLGTILTQRAQGQEPNLSVLLGIKSLSLSMEESDSREPEDEELMMKLREVAQLRQDIEELRKSMAPPPALH